MRSKLKGKTVCFDFISIGLFTSMASLILNHIEPWNLIQSSFQIIRLSGITLCKLNLSSSCIKLSRECLIILIRD